MAWASSDRSSLLPAEANGLQLCVIQREKPLGHESPGSGDQPIVRRLRGCQRDLLLQDDMDQGVKSRFPRPQRRRSVRVQDDGEIRVPGREFPCCLEQ